MSPTELLSLMHAQWVSFRLSVAEMEQPSGIRELDSQEFLTSIAIRLPNLTTLHWAPPHNCRLTAIAIAALVSHLPRLTSLSFSHLHGPVIVSSVGLATADIDETLIGTLILQRTYQITCSMTLLITACL